MNQRQGSLFPRPFEREVLIQLGGIKDKHVDLGLDHTITFCLTSIRLLLLRYRKPCPHDQPPSGLPYPSSLLATLTSGISMLNKLFWLY